MLTDTINEIVLRDFPLTANKRKTIRLSFQSFGKELYSAPIVLVNHALTGNSTVAGPNGWWRKLIGYNEVINLNNYTVIAFDIPGNGHFHSPENWDKDYSDFTTNTVAKIFWKGLHHLGIDNLYAVIGGSLGGSIAWEMAFLQPHKILHLIPIACSLKASDWLIGNVLVQDSILNNSTQPIKDARMHAMHLYRTPASFQLKFDGSYKENEQLYAVESWLRYHGNTLENRFHLTAYKVMNHLLKTVGRDLEEKDLIAFAKANKSDIHCIAIDSDYLFTREEQWQAYKLIHQYKPNIYFTDIQSIHGHDAFLIEYEQINNKLTNIF